MTLLSMFLKPFVIGAFMMAYKAMISAMWRYLPYKVSSFLLKER